MLPLVCFLYTLYPAVPVSISKCFSPLSVLFGSSPHLTACGRVISHRNVNRWETGSRSPRVSPHYCFTSGVKFPQGEGSAVIHRMKNYLLYKDATCLCSPSASFLELLAGPSSIRTLLLSG